MKTMKLFKVLPHYHEQGSTTSSGDIASSRSPANDIPTEILNQIYEDVEGKDLKALRLVNKHFSAPATPSFFEVVHFLLLPESIEKVKNIGNHPEIRFMVRELVYAGNRLPTEYFRNERWPNFVERLKFPQACAMLAAQEKLLSSGDEMELLSWLFQNMPGLASFKLTTKEFTKEYNKKRSKSAYVYEGIKNDEQSSSRHFLHKVAVAMSQHKPNLWRMLDDDFYLRHNTACLSVLQSMTAANPAIKRLQLHVECHAYHYGNYILCPQVDHSLGMAFRATNVLDVCFEVNIKSWHRSSKTWKHNVRDRLALFPYLEYLNLSFVRAGVAESLRMAWLLETIDVEGVLEGLFFPRLEAFNLKHAHLTTKSFVMFIQKHARTLYHSEIEHVYLAGESHDQRTGWEQAIYKLAPITRYTYLYQRHLHHKVLVSSFLGSSRCLHRFNSFQSHVDEQLNSRLFTYWMFHRSHTRELMNLPEPGQADSIYERLREVANIGPERMFSKWPKVLKEGIDTNESFDSVRFWQDLAGLMSQMTSF